ncbi:hypothetical protein WG68_00130 [Arsukibacterium ikkense]|uniref:DUF4824 domain-containing protein n=1 Tax=Arsukibacterium ikkense TaxID=336831 RepID=A0A0M2V9L0_9GAMM|nr:DUF4824 family protein [Arsukibacterium ikkense]KKO47104.1 hypothetical protein WG68_00130 [Arsukibacterium ikkense]
MANSRSTKLPWLAVAAVVLVNSVILGKVLINRSDTLAELPLTERELRLPGNYGFAREDSAKRLSLQWTTPNPEPINEDNHYRYRHTNRSLVLSEQHFASFQFGPCQPERYRRQQQAGWVLLEFNGPGYQQALAQAAHYNALAQQAAPGPELAGEALLDKQQRAAALLQAATDSATRLYVIDAAANPALLQKVLAARSATANGTLLIVPAELQPGYARCNKAGQTIPTEIMVNRLAVESLYVPKHLAQALPQHRNSRETVPFQATIHYGKLHQPWISSLE